MLIDQAGKGQEAVAAHRQAALTRMRLLATGLLGLMLLVYLLANHYEPLHPAIGFLRAFAEAGLVGGIADWFAVTALFRKPLGLPIPHTAILPRNKDRIADSLGDFVAGNFLTPEVVLPKLHAADPAGRLARWLTDEAHSRFIAARVAAAGPPLLSAMQDEPVRRLLRDVAVGRLDQIEAAPLLARVLTILVAGGQHMALFDRSIDAGQRWVIDNEETIRERVAGKTSWWVPDWLDDKLAQRVITGLIDTLEEMRDPEHPWRGQFHEAVAEFMDRLVHDPQTRARGEALKREIIAHPQVQAYLESLWAEAKKVLIEDLQVGGRIEPSLCQALVGLGHRLGEDAALRATVNGWGERFLMYAIVPNRARLGAFMAGVVRSWDTRTFVGRLELHVGRDLQYIRINGTVVGGLVGLAIHAVSLML